jgi:shikimate dehydrogenase
MTYISAKTKILAIIGHPIEHSMSPIIHNAAIQDFKLDYIYLAFDIDPPNLRKAVEGFRALNIKGINVTLPYKEEIIKFLDEIDPTALNIGAINTIKNENGYLKARNTDGAGAIKSLIENDCELKNKNVLFIGAGGAARALSYFLAEHVNQITFLNIRKARSELLAKQLNEKTGIKTFSDSISDKNLKKYCSLSDILINASPIGMYPKNDETPVPKEFLHTDLFVFDLVYNPLETKLLRDAIKIGCKTLGGLDMLINQAILAFEWWTGKTPKKELMMNTVINFLGAK